jgi:anti-sigma B factor antagonist
MKMENRLQGQVVILSPMGKLMGGLPSEALHDRIHALIAGNTQRVVIDLQNIEWINSLGLGIVIAGLTSLRNAGGDLRLANANPKIKELLSRTKLLSVFQIYSSTDSAVASFQR